MLRTIQHFVIGTALLTLFLSMSPANVQAAAGPCDAGDGHANVVVCADFLAYVRDSLVAGNASVSVTIPESTMASYSREYAHNWHANPVAYIPESTVRNYPLGYAHDWDANPVAYIPESTMDISLEEILGLQEVGR